VLYASDKKRLGTGGPYQQKVIGTYSKLGFANVLTRKTPLIAAGPAALNRRTRSDLFCSRTPRDLASIPRERRRDFYTW
jgi:hypothetical protein